MRRYKSRPRIVSHRASALAREESGLQQAVVKIQSLQSFARFQRKPKGELELLEGTDEVKERLEYLVIQKMMFDGVEEPWKLWGTVEETDPQFLLPKASTNPPAETAPG